MLKPIFTSHFSIGKSILNLKHPSKQAKDGSDSIFSIALEGGLKELILVEESMIGFFDAFKISQDLGIQLIFGYKFSCNNDQEDKNSIHKLIAFAKNDEGCKQLNKLYSLINSKLGGIISNKQLEDAWSDDLLLVVPFYDSFLFKNSLTHSSCIPNIDNFNPTFFIENNNLPFDRLMTSKVLDYLSTKPPLHQTKIEKVKSIYYKNKCDFEAFQTFKILNNRKFGKQLSLNSPNLEHFCSNEFCWESFLEAK
jgi:DNA polymerase III alpha subunit